MQEDNHNNCYNDQIWERKSFSFSFSKSFPGSNHPEGSRLKLSISVDLSEFYHFVCFYWHSTAYNRIFYWSPFFARAHLITFLLALTVIMMMIMMAVVSETIGVLMKMMTMMRKMATTMMACKVSPSSLIIEYYYILYSSIPGVMIFYYRTLSCKKCPICHLI